MTTATQANIKNNKNKKYKNSIQSKPYDFSGGDSKHLQVKDNLYKV